MIIYKGLNKWIEIKRQIKSTLIRRKYEVAKYRTRYISYVYSRSIHERKQMGSEMK